MNYGSCNFAPSEDFEHVKDLLERKHREREANGLARSASFGTSPSTSLTSQSVSGGSLQFQGGFSLLRPSCAISSAGQKSASSCMHAPFATCLRRYKNMNKLRSDYLHLDNHGAVGRTLLTGGLHECLGNSRVDLAAAVSVVDKTSSTDSQGEKIKQEERERRWHVQPSCVAPVLSQETLRKSVTDSLSVIFSTNTYYRRLLSCSKPDAQNILDAFQTLLDAKSFQDRKQMIAAMCRFSKDKNLYPTQLFLKKPPEKLGDEPDVQGKFGDLYKISFEGKNMCFKAIRKYQNLDVEQLAKAYAKEAIPWAQLSHRNILPFYGLARIGLRFAFVSPWAANGNLEYYLKKNPGANRLLLCADTAAGMEYLHRNNIVHGDLKGLNVLIDSSGRAALGDFGLSSVTDPQILKWSTQSTMASKGGTERWQAPELLAEEDKKIYNTKESDVYAWASVCYEIFTGRYPYYKTLNPTSVMRSILRGETPTRPEDSDAAWQKHGLTLQMWGLMEECWAFRADQRPDASAVVERLENAGLDTREDGEWMDRPAMRFSKGEEVRDAMFWEGLESLLARVVPALN